MQSNLNNEKHESNTKIFFQHKFFKRHATNRIFEKFPIFFDEVELSRILSEEGFDVTVRKDGFQVLHQDEQDFHPLLDKLVVLSIVLNRIEKKVVHQGRTNENFEPVFRLVQPITPRKSEIKNERCTFFKWRTEKELSKKLFATKPNRTYKISKWNAKYHTTHKNENMSALENISELDNMKTQLKTIQMNIVITKYKV